MVISNAYNLAKSRVLALTIENFSIGCYILHQISERSIPLLGEGIERILAVWSLLAVIVGVRQGLDIKTRWAVLICLVGWPLIQIAIGFMKIIEQLLSVWF
ncbi:MAG: hypothetical protein ACM65L_19170 [Microcoleus sp.]